MNEQMDPRSKLVMVICISTWAVLFDKLSVLFGLLAGSILILLMLKVDLSQVYHQFKKIIPILVMLMLIQSIFSPEGKVLWQIGHTPLLTVSGIQKGLSVGLRMTIIVFSALILTTVNSYDLMLGLVQWKVPYEIAFMVFIATKFLPIFFEEAHDTLIAVQMRGVDLKTVSLRQKINLYVSMITPILFGAVLKAQKMAIAMETRGARAYPRRTYMRQLSMGTGDKVLVGCFIGSSFILIFAYLIHLI